MVPLPKNMTLTLLPISCVLGFAGAWIMSRYAYRLGLIDLPNERSSHALPTPRGGGVGILFAFVSSALVLGIPQGLTISATMLALASFFDDRLGLSPRSRLILQFLSAFGLLLTTAHLQGSFSLCILLAAWSVFIVGTANFYNFMDGINGIAGITGVVAFLLMALYSYFQGDVLFAMLAGSVSMACLGFLPLNMPRARVFMGDVGSILLGFCFAAFVMLLTRDISDFLTLGSFLFTFYADALSTLYLRWRRGERLSQAHRSHLYQLLANELRVTHWQVSLIYGVVQLSVGSAMLSVHNAGLLASVTLIVAISLVFCVIMFQIRRAVGNLESGNSSGDCR